MRAAVEAAPRILMFPERNVFTHNKGVKMRHGQLGIGGTQNERPSNRTTHKLLKSAVNSWRESVDYEHSDDMCDSKWFSHSGDLGDIIYSLPAAKSAGGGRFYLCPGPGTNATMTLQRADLILPLLRSQPYVRGAEFTPECRPSSLNSFRHYLWQHPVGCKTLIDAHFDALAISPPQKQEKWLEIDPLVGEFRVLLARSLRYQNPAFNWHRILHQYRADAVFVGLAEEHLAFCRQFGDVPFLRTENLLELAHHIAGAKLFIGNQSCPMAIAHGLHAPVIMEVATGINDNCRVNRSNAIYAIDDMFELPEIE